MHYVPPSAPVALLPTVQSVCDTVDVLMVRIGLWTATDQFDPELALSEARRLLTGRDTSRPTFLWVHLYPPHMPYAAPPPYLGRFDRGAEARTRFDSSPPSMFSARLDNTFPRRLVGRYDESLYCVDDHLGRFLDWLKGHGLFDDSLVVVSADHGESFAHRYGGHDGPMLYEDLIRIPLLVKRPHQQRGMHTSVLTEQIDVMPTVLDVAGVHTPLPSEGRSLTGAMRGERTADKPIFTMNLELSAKYSPLSAGSVAMIDGRWKYVHFFGPLKYPLQPRLDDGLYDLSSDVEERVDVAALHPAVAHSMLTAIERQLNDHGGDCHD